MPKTLLKWFPVVALVSALGLALGYGVALGEARACNQNQDAALSRADARITAVEDEQAHQAETMAVIQATQVQMLDQMRTLNTTVADINSFLREAAGQ